MKLIPQQAQAQAATSIPAKKNAISVAAFSALFAGGRFQLAAGEEVLRSITDLANPD